MAKGFVRPVCALLCILLLTAISLPCQAALPVELITDFNSLKAAISQAKEGDTLLVGDISFLPSSPDIENSFMYIEINKSLTILNGKADGAAVFTNGGFVLKGSKAGGKKSVCRFIGISFEGDTDKNAVVAEDFNYPEGKSAPMKAQQALSFAGNVDATFEDCEFKGYMHENGPVIDIRYDDYTDNAYLLDLFGDNSGCRLSISFEGCRIENNCAFYDGGCIYIEACNNVSLTARDCVFAGNLSGAGDFCRGGGAVFAKGATLSFKDCRIENNSANHVYQGLTPGEYDTHRGGALLLEGCSLKMVNCVVEGNRASMGGGIALTNTKGDMDGCFFSGNRAEAFATNPDGMTGPWCNMAQGGALYMEGNDEGTLTLTNCEIKENFAATAYGGIYVYYTPNEDPTLGSCHLKLNLCTYTDNTCGTDYDYSKDDIIPWGSHPGDMFANPHITLFGCLVVDESFLKDFPHEEAPTAENGYNSLSAAPFDGKAPSIPLSAAAKVIERYGHKLKEVYVGSNYSEDLYKEPPTQAQDSTDEEKKAYPVDYTWYYVIAIGGGLLFIAVAALIAYFIARKRKAGATTAALIKEAPKEKAAEKKQIVMTRYSDKEIERFLSLTPEVALLTGRELEVLNEILHGKKQGEVAYYLGIEVSTVKDFYKKIYTKLEVPNKEGLFVKVSAVLENK